jgi:hypothetical protein
MIGAYCSLCKRSVEIAKPNILPTPAGGEYILLWDNINASAIGTVDEIPFPSWVFCEKCIPKARRWLKMITPKHKETKPENAKEEEFNVWLERLVNFYQNKKAIETKPEKPKKSYGAYHSNKACEKTSAVNCVACDCSCHNKETKPENTAFLKKKDSSAKEHPKER